MRGVKKTAFVIAIVLAFAGSSMAQRGQKQDNQKREEEEKPSDFEKGLSIFQSVIKTVKASRPLGAKEERKIGRAVAKQVFMRYGKRVEDRDLNRYVNLVGRTVAAASGGSKIKYRFAVINNREANAFAAPGGYIFITTGLLGKLGSEAQLAGVLAHEVAHVSKKHMVKAIQQARKLEGLAELSATVMDKDPKEFMKIVGMVTDILFTTGLEKKKEFEADRVGTEYAANTGYDAHGLAEFLIKLKRSERSSGSIFFSTHPPVGKRISKLQRDVLPRHGKGQVLAKRFARNIK